MSKIGVNNTYTTQTCTHTLAYMTFHPGETGLKKNNNFTLLTKKRFNLNQSSKTVYELPVNLGQIFSEFLL